MCIRLTLDFAPMAGADSCGPPATTIHSGEAQHEAKRAAHSRVPLRAQAYAGPRVLRRLPGVSSGSFLALNYRIDSRSGQNAFHKPAPRHGGCAVMVKYGWRLVIRVRESVCALGNT